jgi:hypothetical protein
MALYFLFTMRIINKNEYIVKSDEVDEFNNNNNQEKTNNLQVQPSITLLDIYEKNKPENDEFVNNHYERSLFSALLRYIDNNEYDKLTRVLKDLNYDSGSKLDNTKEYFLGLINQYADEVKNQNKNNIPIIAYNNNNVFEV